MATPNQKPKLAAVPNPAPQSVPAQTAAPALAAAPAAATSPTPARSTPAQPQAPSIRRLKKGELLFAEGETSRAMYLLKNGIVRIFKKKGDAQIEIDSVHSGQILGELAFLDGNPRSASGEALTDCEVVEISGPAFTSTLSNMPDWLKILLKTVVGRLRTSSTRIKQLETASTALQYGDNKDGKQSSSYVYFSVLDVMKLGTALLLVAIRNGKETAAGHEVRMSLLQRYANQIMGIPVSKITTFIDVLNQAQIIVIDEENNGQVTLTDTDFLEQLIAYLNEENLLEPEKKHDISLKGFMIMSLIAKHLSGFPKDDATGMSTVNMADIKKAEMTAAGKEPFRMDDFSEMVKLGYATALNLKSVDEMFTLIHAERFLHSYRLQRVGMMIQAVNEQKRKNSGSR